MSEEYWTVKRSAYACVCITPDMHGSVTVWETREAAWADAEERVKDFINEEGNYLKYKRVEDGYEILTKNTDKVVRYYKVFEEQELE